MRRTGAAIAAAAFAIAVLLAGAPSALGHAKFVSVTPPAGAKLDEPPATIEVEFSKSIEGRVKDVVLIEPGGRQLDDVWSVSATTIEIAPPADMGAGVWTVRWRVLGSDGHPLLGTSRFAIGDADASTAAGASGDDAGPHAGMDMSATAHAATSYPHRVLERVALFGRVLFFGGLLLFVGGVIFALVVAPGWQPRFWNATAASTILGAGLVLGTHAAIADERSLLQMANPLVWARDAVTVGVRGYVLSAVAVVLLTWLRWHLDPAEWRHRRAAVPPVIVALVLVAAGAPSLSGHAADGTALFARIPLDALHVLAGSAWLGGLVQLLTITVRERNLDPRMYAVVGRYSRLATGAVVVLVATGVFATFDELEAGIGELVGSTWGRLIILKAALLAATAPLANLNRLRNVPGVGEDPAHGVPRLRRFVAIELLIVVWVVLATAMVVYETPPDDGAQVVRAAASG